MKQLKRTVRVRLDETSRITGCIVIRCQCESMKYIRDGEDPGVYECIVCNRPFVYIDDLGYVYPISQRLKKGVDRHNGS